jgi:hypothetical protein
MRKRISKEEMIAKKLAIAVSDVTLDLDEIGRALATEPTLLVNRLDVVLESAIFEKEDLHERHNII